MDDAWLNQILDQLEEGVHVVDLEGNTCYYNRALGLMEGMVPQDLLGQSLLRHFPSLSKETSTLWHVLKTGKTLRQVSQTYLNPRGEKITTVNDTYPLMVDGELMGAFEIAKDLSRVARLTEQVVQLQSELHPPGPRRSGKHQSSYYHFEDIITQSERMLKVLEKAKRAASTDVSILITGETGTGKEMVAQSIHTYSPRAAGPFIAQNCAALPESLLEGILFGTVKGSFTGATDRPGLFEQAQGGTLLLDEIDSMGLNLQAKLLRVLQEGRVRRLGDIREKEIDVRVVATMNRPPEESIQQGRIRPDLYYRLNVLEIRLPALRERREDIERLTYHFLNGMAHKHHRAVPEITPETLATLKNHNWPGNVRELAHVIEGGLVVTEHVFGWDELPNYLQLSARRLEADLEFEADHVETGYAENDDLDEHAELRSRLSLPERVRKLEAKMIQEALAANKGNLTRAAKQLGIPRQSLQYKLRNQIHKG